MHVGDARKKEDLANYVVLLQEIRNYTDALYEGANKSKETQGMIQ